MNDNILNKIINFLNYIIILALLLTSIFLFRQNTILKEELARELIAETNTETKTDTIWKSITIHDTIPRETIKEKTIIKLDTVEVNPIHNPDDTVPTEPIFTALELVKKTYEGTTKDSTSQARWRANVEGYSLGGDDEYPRLSRMDIDITTPQLTTTQVITNTITKRKRWNVSLGAGAGVGITTKKPDVYVGLNIGCSIY